jgi:hypothetical protein
MTKRHYRVPGQLSLDLLETVEPNRNIIYRSQEDYNERLESFCTHAAKKAQSLVVDLETSSYLCPDRDLIKNEKFRLPRRVQRENSFDKNALNPHRLSIRLIQIEFEGKVLVFDCWLDDNERFLNWFFRVIASDRYKKIFHNASFDLNALRFEFGVRAKNIACTRILSNMIYAGEKYEKHTLGDCIKRELEVEIDKSLGKSDWGILSPLSNAQLDYAVADVIWTRKLYDSLWRSLNNEHETQPINKDCALYTPLEVYQAHMNALPAIAEMSFNGIAIDVEKAKIALKQWEDMINAKSQPSLNWLNGGFTGKYTLTSQPAKLSARIYELSGVLIKKEVLDHEIDDEELIAMVEDETVTNLFGESEQHLSARTLSEFSATAAQLRLASSQNETLELLDDFVLCKSMLKQVILLKTMIQAGRIYKEPRLYGSFNALGNTASGRSTCGSGGHPKSEAFINLQNFPKLPENKFMVAELIPPRSCIVPSEGYKFVAVDASSSHSRLAFSITKCPGLEAVLNDPIRAKLAHSIMASEVFKMKGENFTPEEIEKGRKDKSNPRFSVFEKARNLAKTCFFSMLNCASSQSIQASLAKQGVYVTLEEVDQTREAWAKLYPGVASWQNENYRFLNDKGRRILRRYVRKDGSKYAIPQLKFRTIDGRLFSAELKDRQDRKTGEIRRAVNIKRGDSTSCQLLSPESYAFNQTLYDMMDIIEKRWDYDLVRILLFEHDAILIEAKSNLAYDVSYELNKTIDKWYTFILRGVCSSGIDLTNEKEIRSAIIDNYADK